MKYTRVMNGDTCQMLAAFSMLEELAADEALPIKLKLFDYSCDVFISRNNMFSFPGSI